MRTLFFTSNTNHYHKVNGEKIANDIDNTNGMVDQFKQLISNNSTILYIAGSPNDINKVDAYASLLFEGLKLSGITFSEYLVLDNRTKSKVEEYVKRANVIFLSGGATYVENLFFQELNLKRLLQDFEGVIIGQSAGSMNLAEFVYNSPENGTESEAIYFEGLGLSNINIEPHFILDETEFDEMQIYERQHQIEESKKRPIYALCDGSHILENEESVTIYGKAFLIKDGIITQICDDKQKFNIDKKSKTITK